MTKVVKLARTYPVVVMALVIAIVAGILTFTAGPNAAQIVISVFAGAFAAWTAVGMVKDILHGHFGLDILALIAILSTLIVGEYWASLIVVLMLSGGEALEDYAQSRAKRDLASLLDNSPTDAHLLARNGATSTGDEATDIPVDQVQVGDLILVRPADVVPVDAVLVSDSGTFDESSISGESLPVQVYAGTEVPSGALNGAQAVRMRAVRPSSESQYQQIIKLVSQAEEEKAPVVRIADRFAVPFTLVSLLIAGTAWAISGDPVRFAEVLVLATPCPLLIAAPVAFMGGMSRSAKNGIIVKGGAALETASRVKAVAFDKTGTLTKGEPEIVTIRSAGNTADDSNRILQLAASAEQYSNHVLAESIRTAAEKQQLQLLTADVAHEDPGQGVRAKFSEKEIFVGRLSYVQQHAPSTVASALEVGQVGVYVAEDDRFLGCIVLADQIRPEAHAVVSWLKDNGIEHIEMVTGDAEQTAEEVAKEIGINEVHAALHPADKVKVVAELQPKPTMMLGDGVNDAPVLAASDIGVAMGARGSTAAGEAADAIILWDSLTRIPALVTIARDTMKVALTAIWIGIGLSVILMLVATTGYIPAVAGAFTQEIVDLSAITYALRALGGRLPSIAKSDRVSKKPQKKSQLVGTTQK